MPFIKLLCMVLAVVLFLLAALGVTAPRVQFGRLGLMFLAIWFLLP